MPAYVPNIIEVLRAEAAQMVPHTTSEGARRFLFATNFLRVIEGERTIYYNAATRDALSPAMYEKLAPEGKAAYVSQQLNDEFYYLTRYGTPIAYVRALDLACAAMRREPGNCFTPGVRVLDFGYGGIGHLHNLATMGLHTVGVDVDPMLAALYSDPEDTGAVPGGLIANGDGNFGEGPPGSITLAHGRWPADEAVRTRVGSGFDLIVSKNTLKRGFIHPEKPVPDAQRVNLGVEDDAFVAALAGALKPGGVLMIYNIHPAQKKDGEGYMSWADGRCPFPREMFEKHGLVVREFDKDDSTFVRVMGAALKWDTGQRPMDLQNDLFATYTLVLKPSAAGGASTPPKTVR